MSKKKKEALLDPKKEPMPFKIKALIAAIIICNIITFYFFIVWLISALGLNSGSK